MAPSASALGKLRPVRGGKYLHPDGRTFSKAQVAAGKKAAGITPALTQALAAKGYGRTWVEQVQRATAFDRATRRGTPQKDAGKQLLRTLTRAATARDSLASLVTSYGGKVRERTGEKRTTADLLAPGSGLWKHLNALSRAKRDVVRDGKSVKVGPNSRAARELVALGLRPEWATWRVGESPIADRVAAFLAREDGAPPPWESLNQEERDRVNAALQDGGELRERPKRSTYRQAQEDVIRAVGKRSKNDPRRNER